MNHETLKPLGRAVFSHRTPLPVDRFWFGAPYYPEHWSAADRTRDAQWMADAGFNVVRMAEFAWDRIEPREGVFDFSLFDDTLDRLRRKGISAIMCTPTATPPRWLTRRYPEWLCVDADNNVMQHGSRQHCCQTSETFRSHSRRITRAMAEHYRNHPGVVGWQTDNEIYCHFAECHCEFCQEAFRAFVWRKFDGDIAALNAAWGTAFWSQSYTSFEEILTPRQKKPAIENPAQRLDYCRFLDWRATRFQREQVEILRGTQRAWFVFHNGCFDHVDYRGPFVKDLDFLAYDTYPMFNVDPEHRAFIQAHRLDRTRCYSGNFFVPEHQSGPGGQGTYFHDNPEPGEVRLMTYVSIARGADSLMYFRWRTCRFGAEEYWCGILDHDNVRRRRYEEVRQTGKEVRRVGPAVLGTSVHIDCAVAGGDYDVRHAEQTASFGLPDTDSQIGFGVHREFLSAGYAVGVVHPDDDLSGIKAYVIPHWALFDPDWVPALETYVRGGGVLVVGARTATRDMNNNVVPESIPGCLRTLTGVTVKEYGRRNASQSRMMRLRMGKATADTESWYEVLDCDGGATPLAVWEGRHLDGEAAVSVRRVGKGRVIYVGTLLTSEITALLMPKIVKWSGLKPLWPDAPRGVQVVLRKGRGKRVWFFLNRADDAATISATPKGTDLLSGRKCNGGAVTLPRYGVKVVQEDSSSRRRKRE